MTLQRGAIIRVANRRMVVISGGMFNSLPNSTVVIAVPVIDEPPGPLVVSLPDGGVAEVGHVMSVPKDLIDEALGRIDGQILTNINNMLFKILATELASVLTVVAHPQASGPRAVPQAS